SSVAGSAIWTVAPLCFLLYLIHANKFERAIFRNSPDIDMRDRSRRSPRKKITYLFKLLLVLAFLFLATNYTFTVNSLALRWVGEAFIHDSVLYLLIVYSFTTFVHLSAGWMVCMFLIQLWGILAGSD